MKYEVLNNVFLTDKNLLMEVAVPAAFQKARPGQFLHIRVDDSCDPLLRRPLSIYDVARHPRKGKLILRFLYEVAGKGTALLAKKKPFSEIDCLGPLGNGFDVRHLVSFKMIHIVAGGMGVAPLFFLVRKIREIQNSKSKIQIKVLLGAKTKSHIFCERELKGMGCEVKVATDDGSRGFKGYVTGLLQKELSSLVRRPSSVVICSCGPSPMQKTVSELARRHHLSAYVSLEEFMGCGLGACLGCAIRTVSGYRRICHDGPVFEASEIIWKE